MGAARAAQAPHIWTDGEITHIDVRELPRPLPLVHILQLVQRLPADAVLIAHHDRDPVLLYPELLALGWWAEPIAGDPGEVRLRIARQEPS